jgi:hypothetical protein
LTAKIARKNRDKMKRVHHIGIMSESRKPGATVRDEQVFREAINYVKSKREPSPCPCKSKDCMDYNNKLIEYIATIKTCYEPEVKPTIIAVSGFGHVSAETYVKHPPRKDEAYGGAGKA